MKVYLMKTKLCILNRMAVNSNFTWISTNINKEFYQNKYVLQYEPYQRFQGKVDCGISNLT